jgi:predicted nucleic acid-binding protein
LDRLRVVFDCMIFLQAATRFTGPASALLELAEIGELELLVSDACLEEIRDVLTRPSCFLDSYTVGVSHSNGDTIGAWKGHAFSCPLFHTPIQRAAYLQIFLRIVNAFQFIKSVWFI